MTPLSPLEQLIIVQFDITGFVAELDAVPI